MSKPMRHYWGKPVARDISSFAEWSRQNKFACAHASTFQCWIKTCENAVKNLWTVQFHMFFTPFSQGVKLLRPCEQGIFHKDRTHAKPCEFFPSEKTCERPCEKPLKNLWTFSVFHMVENVKTCEQGIFHRVRTHAKPCEKPCEFFPSEKTCERPCEKPLKNLWTFSVFHMVENVKTCEQGIFHRVRTHAKPCEKPCENPVNFHSVFHRVEDVKTCQQGIFHRDRTCEKPSEMGVYLVLWYMQAILFNSEPYYVIN